MEKMKGRAIFTSGSMTFGSRRRGAVAPESLAKRADGQVDLARKPGGGGRARAAGTKRASSVRLVDHQETAVAARQVEQLGERGNVPVHGEDASVTMSPPAGFLAQAPGQVLRSAWR